MFFKKSFGTVISPFNVVQCSGGGSCNVGSSTDCKQATGNSENEGSHNQNTQSAMSSSPGK